LTEILNASTHGMIDWSAEDVESDDTGPRTVPKENGPERNIAAGGGITSLDSSR